jgi:hypothetical protein
VESRTGFGASFVSGDVEAASAGNGVSVVGRGAADAAAAGADVTSWPGARVGIASVYDPRAPPC